MFSKVDILSFERSSPTHSFCSTWYLKMHPHPQQNHYDYWSKTTYLFLPGISSKTELPSYRPIFFVTWKSCDICKYLKNKIRASCFRRSRMISRPHRLKKTNSMQSKRRDLHHTWLHRETNEKVSFCCYSPRWITTTFSTKSNILIGPWIAYDDLFKNWQLHGLVKNITYPCLS